MKTLMLPTALCGFVCLAVAVNAAVAGDDKPPPTDAEKLEPYQCGKVERLHTLAGVFLASQPTQEDFVTAQEGGIKTVINLRLTEELDWDEEAHVQQLGMEYHHIGFKSPDSLTDEVFDRVRELLTDKDKRPLLIHCATANRVGAVWLAHRVLDGGLPYEDALAEAKTVGLKLPAYETKAREYIERMRQSDSR
jgi:uncharacterized protein (TIGR01244 family)